jgi:phytoene desaturase
LNILNKSSKHSIIIGSGFAGIATALRLKSLGHKVTLIERLDQVGGRARSFKQGDYKHDAGPTVITAPFLFRELFELFDENLDDYLEFVHLDPYYRFYFSETDEHFNYHASVEDTLTEIRRFSNNDAKGYLSLLDASKEVYDIGFKKLAHRPFNKLFLMMSQIPALIKLKCYRTVWKMVGAYLKHPLIRKAFSIHPLLVGGNPFTTTSIYALIHYLERKWGVFFCMGGTSKLVSELENLMVRQNINILKNADVIQINHNKKQVKSIELSSGEMIDADNIVFAGDPEVCYTELLNELPPSNLPFLKPKYSMGLYVLYFGTKKTYDKVAHHTIWMGKEYESLLSDIFDKKILNNDFSLYLHRPTATDKSFAPDGCDSFYVLCPVPNLQGSVNWDEQGEILAKKIINALEETILPNLSEVTEDVFWMTPIDFKNDYRSMHGSGFSIEPTLTQSAWFRYHNKHKMIENLYFAGAGTHPGAGLPGVISSAKVVEELITGIEVKSVNPRC